MRVIAGVRKGLKLKAPDGLGTRPTTDRVKESLFNIIQTHLPAKRVLDLFAGSAALGIEALSRRSEECVFVECDKKALMIVKDNISSARFNDVSSVIKTDALTFLDNCIADESGKFDIIFMDPPYNKGLIAPALDKIHARHLLSDNGIVVIETEKDGEEPSHPDFTLTRQAVYGKTVVTVLTRGDTD